MTTAASGKRKLSIRRRSGDSWTPEPTPFEDDPLIAQQRAREAEDAERHPEGEARIVRASNSDDPGVVPVDPPSLSEGNDR